MLKKTFFILSSLLVVTALTSFVALDKKQKAIKTIIIDAGHGKMKNGGYNGAKGSYSSEDEICYEISKKLIQQIAREFPEIKIVETRPTHNITELHERADIANQNRGDLFVSIHVNAAPPKQHKEFIGNKTVVSYTGKGKKRKKGRRTIKRKGDAEGTAAPTRSSSARASGLPVIVQARAGKHRKERKVFL